MGQDRQTVFQEGQLRFDLLRDLTRKPELFEPGDDDLWTHPHIAERMLAAHLNPDLEAASRPPGVIDRTVDWMIERLKLRAGVPILDLGCGPGLYCSRLASLGLAVTGIDFSASSIDYARRSADERGLAIEYRCQNYLTLDEESVFDVVLLIYGDFCVLPYRDRYELLNRVRRALRPDGHFVFDVTAPPAREDLGIGRTWSVADGGFWRPGPHLILEEVFDYPEEPAALRQVAIIEESGTLALYRLWFRYYLPETITSLLQQHGFQVEDLNGDLTGTPYTPDSRWIGIVARKQR